MTHKFVTLHLQDKDIASLRKGKKKAAELEKYCSSKQMKFEIYVGTLGDPITNQS